MSSPATTPPAAPSAGARLRKLIGSFRAAYLPILVTYFAFGASAITGHRDALLPEGRPQAHARRRGGDRLLARTAVVDEDGRGSGVGHASGLRQPPARLSAARRRVLDRRIRGARHRRGRERRLPRGHAPRHRRLHDPGRGRRRLERRGRARRRRARPDPGAREDGAARGRHQRRLPERRARRAYRAAPYVRRGDAAAGAGTADAAMVTGPRAAAIRPLRGRDR